MRQKAALSLAVLHLVLAAMVVPAAAQPPLVSSPADGTLGLDPATPLTLAWTTVPNAAAYVVELSESESFVPILPLKDPQIPAQAGALGQTYLVQFTDGTVLRAGRSYYWRVSAVVNGARVTSSTATFTMASDPLRWLVDHNFSLTRAEDGVDKDKPATVGFIRQGGDKSSQQAVAEFLLGWEGNAQFIPRNGRFALSPSLAFAGKMSSDKEAEDTLAKLAGGVVADWSFGETPTRSLYQTFNVAYEGDQAFDQANLLLEYLFTYSGPGVGRFFPVSAATPVQVLIRPYVLAAFAKPLDAPESMPDDAQIRAGTQVDLKLRLNVLARTLGIAGTLLSVTDRWYWLSGYSRDDANYFSASLDFQVAKGFTFGYSYKRGRDAPAFRGVNRMALTIGVGFGR
jgi:hypothetical protein